jgi:serine protease Do
MNWRSILGIILVGGFVYLLAKGIESGTIGKIEIGNPIEGVKEKISGEKARKEENKEDVEQKTEQGEQGKGKEEVISSKFGVLPSFAEIVEKVSKGVVNISTTRVEEQPNPFWWFFGPSPGPGEEFFRRFFGEPQRRVPTRSLGSGFLITSDGYIVTNSHVVRGATDINVTLWDGRTFKAKIVGIDDATDISILKIDATDLPYLKFGDSNELRVGDWVIAIGNPFRTWAHRNCWCCFCKGKKLGDNKI